MTSPAHTYARLSTHYDRLDVAQCIAITTSALITTRHPRVGLALATFSCIAHRASIHALDTSWQNAIRHLDDKDVDLARRNARSLTKE